MHSEMEILFTSSAVLFLFIKVSMIFFCIFKIQGQMGDANSLIVEVENNLELGVTRVHRLRCMRGAKVMWDHMLTSKISAVSGSK